MNGQNAVLLTFNIMAGATVLLPLFIWMIAGLVTRDGEGGGGEENRWWSWGDREEGWWGRAEEREQGVTLGFVYFWALLLFGGIVWYGNRVLQNDSKEQIKGFLVTLIVFTNLALMLAVLTGDLGVSVLSLIASCHGHSPRLTQSFLRCKWRVKRRKKGVGFFPEC
jgi:hypothetical protein